MTARLLMIALDGADARLLENWIITGDLPNLAAVLARGAMKRLTAPVGATDDALWASFQYGVPVEEHGRYHYALKLSTGTFGMAHTEESHLTPFWRSLASQGLRVAILDVPKCPAPQPLNGIQIVDWLVHGRYFGEPRSYPPSLASEIVERFGPAPPSRCGDNLGQLSDEDVLEIVGNLRISVARKRSAALSYLTAEPWDLFVLGFKEAHCISHSLWNFVDAGHADYDPKRNAMLGHPVRTIFQEIDTAIGELITCAGPRAEVVIFSTTDMEPNGSMDHLMPELVKRLNKWLWDRQATHHESVLQLLPYNENWGALRIQQGTDITCRDRILQEIEAVLFQLVDANSHEPVVTSFARPSSDHWGPKASSLPDLLIQYRPNAFPRAVISPKLGRIEAEPSPMRPGNHRPGGLLVGHGSRSTGLFQKINSLERLGFLAVKFLEGANRSIYRNDLLRKFDVNDRELIRSSAQQLVGSYPIEVSKTGSNFAWIGQSAKINFAVSGSEKNLKISGYAPVNLHRERNKVSQLTVEVWGNHRKLGKMNFEEEGPFERSFSLGNAINGGDRVNVELIPESVIEPNNSDLRALSLIITKIWIE